MKDTLAIREGISGQDDEKAHISSKAGSVKIPSNFTDLEGIATSKTSVRKPSDYPVLKERFMPK
jgi:hypothetical protein